MQGLGMALDEDPVLAHYFMTLDMPELALQRHGQLFAQWLLQAHPPLDFVVRLAREKGVVVMDGRGFAAPERSLRISLANMADEAYEAIGKAIVELIDDDYQRWLEVVH